MSRDTLAVSPLAQRFPLPRLLRFAAPSIGMMLVISLYTIIDGIFIGRYVGAEGLAAVNISFPSLSVLIGLAIMLATGGSALVAKNLGEGRREVAQRRFSLIVASGAVIGLLLAVLYALFMDPILTGLGAVDDLLPACRLYLWAQMPFFPAFTISTFFSTFFIVDGRPMQGLYVSVIGGIANGLLDWLFLAELGMGVFGGGLATGMAEGLSALLGLWYFAKSSRILRFRRFSFEGGVLLKAMGNGSSEMVTQLSTAVTTFLFNMETFRYAGTDGIAAITVILYSEFLLTSLFLGFCNGIAPITSYRYGVKDIGGIDHLIRQSLLVISACALLSFLIAQGAGGVLARFFIPSSPEAGELATRGLRIFSLSFCLSGLNFFASSFLTALSKGRASAICSFARNFAGIVFFVLVLPELFGIDGVWAAVPCADAVALILSFCLVKRVHGALKKKYGQPAV